MLKRFMLGLFVLVFVSCDERMDDSDEPVEGVEAAQKVSDETEWVINPTHLPAYKLPWEDAVPGKADAASDFRKAHPQWYAITIPPPANFRPMKEWEPMQAIIITFSNGMGPNDAVARTLVDIAVYSLPAGEVWVVVDAPQAKQIFINMAKKQGATQADIDTKVKFFKIENNAFWTIDFGPLPLVDDAAGTQVWMDFRYYHERVLDDAIPTRLANRLDVTTYRSPLDFEGGNFQADGEEYCYTSERLYYYTGLKFEQVQQLFKTYYGCKKVVVLKDITNDGTGHVDMFFKLGSKHVAFVAEYTVVDDPINKQRMDDNVKMIEGITYSDGSPGITVYRIPMPHPGKYGSEMIPRTYINSTLYASADGSYKVNLWPVYTGDEELEAQALDAWEKGLPDWVHQGIISDEISTLSGAIHCVSRTVPAVPLAKTVPDGECVKGACQGVEGAYDGFCIANSEEYPGCWGPKWECVCNVCETPGCKIPESCKDGVCDEKTENCLNCAQDCGCVHEFQVCNPVAAKCVENLCGNGVCDPGENCISCIPDCGCKGVEKCSFGVCTENPCDGIPYEGCCDGQLLVYCDHGDLITDECGREGCGWVVKNNWYDCGGHGADPSGKFPRDCKEYDYPPGCEGKECGDNGGGYSCGECEESEICMDGKCIIRCKPACEGKQCGPDGCGGTCGDCLPGFTCSDEGQCVEEQVISEPEPDVMEQEVTHEDTVEQDLSVTEDIAAGVEASGKNTGDSTTGKPAKKHDAGCSAGATGKTGGACLLMLLLLMALTPLRKGGRTGLAKS